MRTQVHYITNIAPLYRKNLWKRILESQSIKTTFFYGKGKSGIKEIAINDDYFKDYSDQFKIIENVWFKNKVLIWQKGVISNSLTTKPNLVILLGEFAVISNWILLLIYRLKSVPVVIYGHGMYGNEVGLKALLRRTYLKIGSAHLVYENHAKKVMTKSGFDSNNIHVFYNSLDYDKQLEQRKMLLKGAAEKNNFFANNKLPTIVFIGRLTEEKKLHYLIRIAANLKTETPINLLFIGKGEMMKSLKEEALKNLEIGTFHFYGACYDEEILGELLYYSDLCISPGNVGLTAIHSLSYGTPVATHSNIFEQGPEVEAIEEGSTGFFFKQHNLEDLTSKTKEWLKNSKTKRETIRKACFNTIDTKYNPNNQLKIYNDLIQKHHKK